MRVPGPKTPEIDARQHGKRQQTQTACVQNRLHRQPVKREHHRKDRDKDRIQRRALAVQAQILPQQTHNHHLPKRLYHKASPRSMPPARSGPRRAGERCGAPPKARAVSRPARRGGDSGKQDGRINSRCKLRPPGGMAHCQRGAPDEYAIPSAWRVMME